MKALVLACMCSLAGAGPCLAAMIAVSDTSVPLAGLAQTATAILVDSGWKPHKIAPLKYAVEVRGFHCDQHSNAALDAAAVLGGLPSHKCRVNSANLKDSKKGKPFGEGRALQDLLDKIAAANPGINFSDCASGGYCGTFAKSIKCTIDTSIANFGNGGRWECVFIDQQ